MSKKIIAYLYSNPLLESPCEADIWGLEVDRVYRDLGGRKELEELLENCLKNPPEYLLIRKLDELGDTLSAVTQNLIQLENLGIEVITTEQNYSSSKLTNPQEIKANLSQLLQQVSEGHRNRRLRQGHARNRIKTSPPPGKAPYGYRRGKERYIIDRSTAPVVKDFFERFLLFGSLRGAVRYLENKYGKKISVSTGRRWLTNVVYRGDTAYQNQEVILDTHVPIISREEFAQIDRLLRRNSSLPPRTASANRSLAGLVICQECQSKLKIVRVTQRGKQKEYLYLAPISCPNKPKCKGIPYQEILHSTVKRICQDLPKAVAEINAPNIGRMREEIRNAIAQKRQILIQVRNLEAEGILDTESADLRSYKLNTEISQLQSQISQLPPVNLNAIAQTVSLPQFWWDLSESERRFYFREFLRQIEIVRQADHSWILELVFIF